MNCKQVNEKIPEYLLGTLDDPERTEIDRHLEECGACAGMLEEFGTVWVRLGKIPDEEPSPRLRERFLAMLEGMRDESTRPEKKQSRLHVLKDLFPAHPLIPRLAAAALLICAGFLAGRLTGHSPEIASLNQQVSELRVLVTASLINQQSAIQRIEGLSMAGRVTDPDESFLSLLLVTLNSDSNVNVRLAAVSALSNFQSNQWVRQELVKSLARENSPLVQIPLIDLLVEMHEDTALDVFRAISDDEQSLDTVRNRARWGIQQLLEEDMS